MAVRMADAIQESRAVRLKAAEELAAAEAQPAPSSEGTSPTEAPLEILQQI
jgi:hypothetical protein